MKKIKIGLLPLYVKLYDDKVPGMRERINNFANEIETIFANRDDTEIVAADVCRLEDDFKAAVNMFEEAKVDGIVTLHLAYSPSLESEEALKNTKLPIVILDTTPNFDYTGDDDNDALLHNHGIHGVQDMCNLLVRNKKEFFIEAGHYLESNVIERVVNRVKGIKIAKSFTNTRVGTIGGAFAGMGDFRLPEHLYKEIGIEEVALSPDVARKYFADVTEEEIDALVKEDKEKYEVEDIPEDYLRFSIRGDLAVRHWIEDNDLTAFTANFLKVDKALGIAGMPFAEANRAMERGIGYAGEGDVLTAAFTGALMSASDEASFIEMFCPDWKNNMIFISHMGEMNTALAYEKPKFKALKMIYADVDTTWICGTYKEGKSTLINLLPIEDNKFRVIVSLVEFKVPECDKLRGKSTCGWFEPTKNIATFLEDYSKLGGTHHLTMMYGDERKTAETFAKVMGYEFYEI